MLVGSLPEFWSITRFKQPFLESEVSVFPLKKQAILEKNCFFLKKIRFLFGGYEKSSTFASLLTATWAVSAVGSEHLPYKQRVGGSNPSLPTNTSLARCAGLFCYISVPRIKLL